MFEFFKNALSGKEYIFRKDLEKFTGGVIYSHTFDNFMPSGNTDIPPKNKIGNKVAYKTDDIAQWLEKNTLEIRSKH